MKIKNQSLIAQFEKLEINDFFGKQNRWTNRLLGYEEFQKNRDLAQVESEYNQDKYKVLLNQFYATVEECKFREFQSVNLDPETAMTVISIGDDIYNVKVSQMRELYYDMIQQAVKPYQSKRICELGAGYGFNLSLFEHEAYGGEYSSNAVSIAQKIGQDVVQFNYYEEKDYNFIRPDSTIISVHSIEQIPDASCIVSSLRKHKEKINFVVHIEPTIVLERNTLLGLFRNRYLQLNDYNQNLIELLKSQSDIEILELNTDIFGLVPLNSSNIIAWRFKK
jgi:hypothetical protein